jgi:Tfp pilus assembly protein PilF
MSLSRPVAIRIAVVVAAVLAVVATTSLVLQGGSRVGVVSRFGDGVRLLPDRPALSFLPIARRVSLPREGSAAVLEVPVRLALPGGASLPARFKLRLEGSGRLPIAAGAVRTSGWDAAWAAWLEPRLGIGPADAAALLAGSPAWREIFPSAQPAAPIDLRARLAPEFAPITLAGADLRADPGPELARAAARDELARRAPPRGRLIVIGLDALDWQLVDELTARGVMPHLGRLLTRSTQVTVRMRPPLLSPLIWTTIATGQPPDVHGVLDFVEQDPESGQPKPITSASRKATALWEMAAAAGRTSAVIGWWATYPASAPPGCSVYSDRLTEQLMGLEEDRPGLADPLDAAERARRLVVRGSGVTPEMLEPLLPVTQAELDAVPSGPAAWDHPIGGAARLMAATLSVERLTDAELARGTGVVLAYLEGTDTVGHLFGACRPPALAGCDPAQARRFGAAVDRYHTVVDGWIGRIVARMSADDTLVILSDHGFTWGDDRPKVASGAHTPTAVFWHRPEALMIAAGPRVAVDRSRRRIEPLDILPALLALAGLPPGDDLPGRAPGWLLRAPADLPAVRWAALAPVTRAQTVELPPEAREEELAKLRALGYLGGDDSGGTPQPAPVAATAVPAAEPTADVRRLEARRQHNLGLTRADAGDLTTAEAAFRAAIAADPTYAPPHYAFARVLRLTSRLDEADAELWRSVDLGLGDPAAALARVAGEYRKLGLPERAGAVLAKAAEHYPESGELWLDLGTLAGERGDVAFSRQCLERAVGLLPEEPVAWRNLAAACQALGDAACARRALTAALSLDPGNQAVRRQLDALGGPLR